MPRLTRFDRILLTIAVAALAIRVAYAIWYRDLPVQGDALTFHLVAQGLADGKGFTEAFPPGGPTAEHPPGLEVLLAGLDVLGANGFLTHRIALGLVGALTVVLIGWLGRRVAGPRVGLTAAALAAVYPMFVTADGALMSETLYGFFLVAALNAAFRVRAAPSWRSAALLGVLIALAALTRGEAIALVVLLAVPVAIASTGTWRARASLWAATFVAFALTIAPWTVHNVIQFDRFVLISNNSNGVFIGANCPDTYGGALIGAWRFQCYTERRAGEDEAAFFARQRRIGIAYALDHADRWPAVIGARLGRLFDVFRVDQSVFFNTAEGRPARPMRWAIRVLWVVLALAVAGAVILARRRPFSTVVLLAPVAMTIAVAVVTYGGTRFRYGAEASLVVLAAVTLAAAWDALVTARLRARRAALPA